MTTGKPHDIAVVPGDGIGPEVIDEAVKALMASGADVRLTRYELGGRRYLATGETLPDEVLAELRRSAAILFGAVGTPGLPPGLLERALLLRLRFELDLYVNVRPFELPNADIVIVRENTEGTYIGEGGFLRKDTIHEVATQGSVNTRMGVDRCLRHAFDLARTRPKQHLTLIHKTNVLNFAGDLWLRGWDAMAREYANVDVAYDHIDACCMHLVRDPSRYDVIVTDNLFGDILTDLAAGLSGGIGRAASANLNPSRTGPSLFEPVHGSAPDIAGAGTADPTAAILSAAMMLEFLGEDSAAARVRDAVRHVEGFSGSTVDIGDAVVAEMR